jgi:hypothetical protein
MESGSGDEMDQIDIMDSTTETIYPAYFKKDVAKLISMYINNYKNSSDITTISYNDIKEKVDIMKQREKKNLATKFLGKLSREELRIENLLKQNKLGNWGENVHFFRYNKAHEQEARKLLDQYIDDEDQPTPLANGETNETNDNDEDVDDANYADEYGYSNGQDGYNDDDQDMDEYDNEDYSNNDNFDL